MVDLMLRDDLVDHRDEDEDLLSHLEDHGTQRVHGCLLQVGGRIQGPGQWVNDSRREIRQVQCVR